MKNEEAEFAEDVKRKTEALTKVVWLLREVLPRNMGGTPDLFYPREDGWDSWEEEAEQTLKIISEIAKKWPSPPEQRDKGQEG